MVEGKNLILATKRFASEKRTKSWFHLFTTLLVLAIGYTAVFYFQNLLIRLAASMLVGLTLVRIFVIYHDYLHKTILQKSLFANAIFTFVGLYVLSPKSIWKRSHDYHHKHNSKLYTSSIGSFPLVTKNKFLAASAQNRRIYLFIRHPLTIALGYIFAFAYGMCVKSIINSLNKHWDSVIALIVHYTIGFLIWQHFGITTFIIAFLLPGLISGGIGSYLFYAQHNFPSATFEDKHGWTYIKAAMDSSCYMEMGPVMRWFTANIGYHHIHHLNARIPFYRLPEAFGEMEELQNPKVTSLSIKDIVRCFRLKAWDPEKQKMVGLKEIYSYSKVASAI